MDKRTLKRRQKQFERMVETPYSSEDAFALQAVFRSRMHVAAIETGRGRPKSEATKQRALILLDEVDAIMARDNVGVREACKRVKKLHRKKYYARTDRALEQAYNRARSAHKK